MQEVNVRVAARVRPILPREKISGEQSCARVISSTKQIVIGENKGFTYDHVFSQKAMQCEIYDTCVRPLIDNLFDGYNSTVFAYGQTGSGKTYTMGTCNQEKLMESEKGIIPRAVSHLFSVISERKGSSRFTVSVSFIEIYKEEVHDLLEPDSGISSAIHIREDDRGNTVVCGVQEHPCETAQDVLDCLEIGSSNRATGSTQMNEMSSRSHCVFTISVCQEWEEAVISPNKNGHEGSDSVRSSNTIQHYMSGKFHFVDLAGSERAYKTGNVGDRFKESIHINTGLLALGNVISALGDPKKKKLTHIPYRDSKITRLLKDSLGGNARTLMICCVSPVWSDCDESINSLKYANRARNIRNKPVLNRDKTSLRFEKLQSEIVFLREQLTRHATADPIVMDDAQLKDTLSRYQLLLHRGKEVCQEIDSRKILSASLSSRVREWLELTNGNNVDDLPAGDEASSELKKRLERAEQDLANDEEIFAEKSKEVHSLREAVQQLEHQLAERDQHLQQADHRLHDQAAHMVELQRRISALEALPDDDDGEFNPPSARRIRSVPATQVGLRRSMLHAIVERDVKSSPALHNLDTVMHGFRVRSQMLASQLEDEDSVLKMSFDESEETATSQTSDVKTSNLKRRGTFRVKKAAAVTEETQSASVVTDQYDKEVKSAQLKLAEANSKVRDLSLNIRMKEELIKQLAKSNKDTQILNAKYEEKIQMLHMEKEQIHKEVHELQKNLKSVTADESAGDTSEVTKMKAHYEQKLEEANAKLKDFSKKQREYQELSVCMNNRDKRIRDLENRILRLREEQQEAARKAQEANELKENAMKQRSHDRQLITELERRQEEQQQIIQKKQEEILVFQQNLHKRSADHHSEQAEESKRLLDSEIEKMLVKSKQVEALEEEVRRREEIVAKKESLIAAKSELEFRRLRASQSFAEDENSLSQSTERDGRRATGDKSRRRLQDEIRGLSAQRDHLQQLRDEEDFDDDDERRLMELEEMIESLNIAIRHNDVQIKSQEERLQRDQENMTSRQDNITRRLDNLSSKDVRHVMLYYFEKVVSLREQLRLNEEEFDRHQMAFSDATTRNEDLTRLLEHQKMEHDRQFTAAQQRYEKEVQILTRHLREAQAAAQPKDSSCHCSASNELSKALNDLKEMKKINKEMKVKIRDWYHQGLIKIDSRETKDGREGHHSSRRHTPQQQYPQLPHHSHQRQQPPLSGRDYRPQDYSSTPRLSEHRSPWASLGRYSEVSAASPRSAESRRHGHSSVVQQSSRESRQDTMVYDSLEDPRNN